MKTISVVIPVFNEEENVLAAHKRVTAVFTSLEGRYDYEILFTDNHSTDRTFSIIEQLTIEDKRTCVVRFSRNFGYQRSILTGYLMAKGDAVVQLDVDLEDPPEMIPTFIEKWENGYQVVYGVRLTRQESWLLSSARKFFYRLIDSLSEDELPRDAGDFRMVDRRIVDELRKLYDFSPYLRGNIAAMGFRQIGVPYHRHARTAGASKFNLRSNLKLALDGILNHSIIPLRFATLVGLISVFIAILLGITYFVARIAFGATWPAGFTTIVLLLLVGIGLHSLFLGIIGEYVGRIFRQGKHHPITIIEKTLNVEESSPGGPNWPKLDSAP